MCAPRVTWHTSIRYSSSYNTCVNMGAWIFFTAAMIHAFRSTRSRGNGGTNTGSLTCPQRKKSQDVMSGDLGGHSISGWSFPDARPIQRPGNTVFRYWRTSQWKWAGLPSYWNLNVGMFCNCGISNSCKTRVLGFSYNKFLDSRIILGNALHNIIACIILAVYFCTYNLQ
jgi:hypothetical protein